MLFIAELLHAAKEQYHNSTSLPCSIVIIDPSYFWKKPFQHQMNPVEPLDELGSLNG